MNDFNNHKTERDKTNLKYIGVFRVILKLTLTLKLKHKNLRQKHQFILKINPVLNTQNRTSKMSIYLKIKSGSRRKRDFLGWNII